LLRVEAGEKQHQELANWWTDYLKQDINGQKDMVKALGSQGPSKGRRRTRRRSPKPAAE